MGEPSQRSTSYKHRDFVSEPMKDKSVRDLAGVGTAIGRRLESAGYDKANKVLGQYLIANKEKAPFQEWMGDVAQSNSKQSSDTYGCLNEWSKEFL